MTFKPILINNLNVYIILYVSYRITGDWINRGAGHILRIFFDSTIPASLPSPPLPSPPFPLWRVLASLKNFFSLQMLVGEF
jgi:hypothetical protein